MAFVSFTPYPGAMAEMLYSPTGMVGRYLTQMAAAVAASARQRAPRVTGDMANSITVEAAMPTGFSVTVDVDYATPVIKGSSPRVITPSRATVLRFPKGGAEVFARRVNHPGNRPNSFLEDALQEVVAAMAFG